jgi:hypothetical protein
VETDRAPAILEAARPLEIVDHDIEDQAMERAASPTSNEPFVKQLLDATRDAARPKTRH